MDFVQILRRDVFVEDELEIQTCAWFLERYQATDRKHLIQFPWLIPSDSYGMSHNICFIGIFGCTVYFRGCWYWWNCGRTVYKQWPNANSCGRFFRFEQPCIYSLVRKSKIELEWPLLVTIIINKSPRIAKDLTSVFVWPFLTTKYINIYWVVRLTRCIRIVPS